MTDTAYFFQQLVMYLYPQTIVQVTMAFVIIGVGLGFLRKMR